MAELIIDTGKIISNIEKTHRLMKEHGMEWSLVVKALAGSKDALRKVLSADVIKDINSIGDSRITNLKTIKEIDPDITTAYIKPPSLNELDDVVRYADISYNTTLRTMENINEEAKRQGKIHKTIIMIELGELREGILGKDLVDLYTRAFNLSNVKIMGIGTNLGCMYGVEPSYDKLVQLSLYKELLEQRFDTKIDLISGGTSITLPLLGPEVDNLINHFRIGEAIFLGTSPYDNKQFLDFHTDSFEFSTDIIEFWEKPNRPVGTISDGNVGHISTKETLSDTNYKAIVDFGIVDVDEHLLVPKDPDVEFVGTTSDMTVYRFTKNETEYQVGDTIRFKPDYMAVAKLMGSQYVKKVFK
ncbi:MAG: alanine racemase [Candidatus Woesearchaeota archaeon]